MKAIEFTQAEKVFIIARAGKAGLLPRITWCLSAVTKTQLSNGASFRRKAEYRS